MYMMGTDRQIDFAKKSLLKVLIGEYLDINLNGLTTKQRTHIYNFITQKIRKFKMRNPNQKDTLGMQQFLKQTLTLRLNQLTNVKQEVGSSVRKEDVAADSSTDEKSNSAFNEVVCVSDSDDDEKSKEVADKSMQEVPKENEQKQITFPVPFLSKVVKEETEKIKNMIKKKVDDPKKSLEPQPSSSKERSVTVEKAPEMTQKCSLRDRSLSLFSNAIEKLTVAAIEKTPEMTQNCNLRDRSLSLNSNTKDKLTVEASQTRRFSTPGTSKILSIQSKEFLTRIKEVVKEEKPILEPEKTNIDEGSVKQIPEVQRPLSNQSEAVEEQITSTMVASEPEAESSKADSTLQTDEKQQSDSESESKRKGRKKRNRITSIDTSVSSSISAIDTDDDRSRPIQSPLFQPVVALDRTEVEAQIKDLANKIQSIAQNDDTIETPSEVTMTDIPLPEVLVTPENPSSPIESTTSVTKPCVKQTRKCKPRRPTNTPYYNIKQFLSPRFRKENVLKIDGSPNIICNYYYELNPKTYELTMGLGMPTEKKELHIEINELLYWPGIGFKISLPELEITRQCIGNNRRDLIKPEAGLSMNDRKMNKMGCQRFYLNKTFETIHSPDKDIEISLPLVISYLELVLESLIKSDFKKKEELEVVLNAILVDVKRLQRIFLKVPYSYSLNEYRYYRTYTHDVETSKSSELMILRETINPEVVFTITRSSFEERNDEINEENLFNYFEAILVEKNPNSTEEFKKMLSKGYIVSCLHCKDEQNGSFSGPMKVPFILNHVGEYSSSDLSCAHCDYKTGMVNLSKQKWTHMCVEVPSSQEDSPLKNLRSSIF